MLCHIPKPGDITAKKTEQALDFEAEMLKDRYLRLYRSLEQRVIIPRTATTTTDDEVATNKPEPKPTRVQDIALASEVAANLATQIFRLEFEGLMRRKTMKELEQGERDAARYV